MNERISGTASEAAEAVRARFYLFGSRPLTHVAFWTGYYILFSLIWATPERGLLASFFLEFVLLPPRMLAVYITLYVLMPRYLLAERYLAFIGGYALVIAAAAIVQRLSGHFFYEIVFLEEDTRLLTLRGFVQAVVLVNTTVITVAAAKMFQHYLVAKAEADAGQAAQGEPGPITVRADRRTHMLAPDDILYIEGLGNYVTYHLTDGRKLVVYGTVKSALEALPEQFFRLHRSYILNRRHIRSFNAENVLVGDQALPRGKDVPDELLAGSGT